MTERVPLVRTKELMEIYELVNRTGSYDSISWNRYATVPGESTDLVRLKNSTGVSKYLFDAQRANDKLNMDVILRCDGGLLPCHRVLLMHFSPLLKELITENLKEIGTPSQTNPIMICLMDYELEHVSAAIHLFYLGNTIFPVELSRQVYAVLDFLKVDNSKLDTTRSNPTRKEVQRSKKLMQYELLTDSEDDEDGDEKDKSTRQENSSDLPEARNTERVTSNNKSMEVDSVSPATPVSKNTNGKRSHSELEETKSNSEPTQKKKKSVCVKEKSAKKPESVREREDSESVKHQETRQSSKHPESLVKDSENSSNSIKTPEIPAPTVVANKGKEPVFQKVPPGSLLQRIAAPRIVRTLKPSPTKSKTKEKPSENLYETEPQPCTSRSSLKQANTNRRRNIDESESDDDENIDESASSKSVRRRKGSKEKRKVRSTERLRSGELGLETNGRENTTLAERVKLKNKLGNNSKRKKASRYPRRAIPDISPSYEELDLPGSQDYDQDLEMGEDGLPLSDACFSEPVSKPGRRTEEFNGFGMYYKCFFCKDLFDTEPDLILHSKEECAKHLNGQFLYPQKFCRICSRYFRSFSHYGIIRHCQYCYVSKGRVQVDEDGRVPLPRPRPRPISRRNTSKSKTSKTTHRINKVVQDPLGLGDKIFNDEKVPIGNPKLRIEKLSDARIRRIIDSVNEGKKVDIPRLPGYNYVKVIPKKEIDFFPDETPEEIMNRLRILEQEQEESRIENERRRLEKIALRKAQNSTASNVNEENLISDQLPIIIAAGSDGAIQVIAADDTYHQSEVVTNIASTVEVETGVAENQTNVEASAVIENVVPTPPKKAVKKSDKKYPLKEARGTKNFEKVQVAASMTRFVEQFTRVPSETLNRTQQETLTTRNIIQNNPVPVTTTAVTNSPAVPIIENEMERIPVVTDMTRRVINPLAARNLDAGQQNVNVTNNLSITEEDPDIAAANRNIAEANMLLAAGNPIELNGIITAMSGAAATNSEGTIGNASNVSTELVSTNNASYQPEYVSTSNGMVRNINSLVFAQGSNNQLEAVTISHDLAQQLGGQSNQTALYGMSPYANVSTSSVFRNLVNSEIPQLRPRILGSSTGQTSFTSTNMQLQLGSVQNPLTNQTSSSTALVRNSSFISMPQNAASVLSTPLSNGGQSQCQELVPMGTQSGGSSGEFVCNISSPTGEQLDVYQRAETPNPNAVISFQGVAAGFRNTISNLIRQNGPNTSKPTISSNNPSYNNNLRLAILPAQTATIPVRVTAPPQRLQPNVRPAVPYMPNNTTSRSNSGQQVVSIGLPKQITNQRSASTSSVLREPSSQIDLNNLFNGEGMANVQQPVATGKKCEKCGRLFRGDDLFLSHFC